MNPELLEKLGLENFNHVRMGADNPARVEELEKAVGYSLPEDYREFLLKFAPSIIGSSVGFRSLEPSPWAENGLDGMGVFLGLEKKPAYDIVSNYKRVHSDVPKGMFPIGYDDGANRILMALDKPAGRVYFQDKDTGNVTLCANSFTDFIASFEEEPE